MRLAALFISLGAASGPALAAEPPRTIVSATDGQVLSLQDAHSNYIALHFLSTIDSPETAAFVREYLREAPTLAGVRHVFITPADAQAAKSWAMQFGAGAIYVDPDGVLAKDLNVTGAASLGSRPSEAPTTVVLDHEGMELFRTTGPRPHKSVAFTDFAKGVNESTKRKALGDYNVPKDKSLALEGYDTVAYFSQGKAAKGKADLSSSYRGVTYRFASAENRLLFATAPEKYLPTYGGWCATAMGDTGTKVEIDPTNFKVKDGRLFLFYKSFFANALDDWNKHEKNFEPAADANWQKLTGEAPIKPAK